MSKPAARAARSTMAWKPRFENGAPRSLTNTKGDLDPCSRCSRRRSKPPLRTQTLGGHVYHGQLAWRDGHWHHATRDGRDGWWWDVGGFWYFYPEQIEGPPDYVSDVEVADNATTAPPAPPEESNYAVYYSPGDLTGTRYQTLEECLQAREQAGNVGECIAY